MDTLNPLLALQEVYSLLSKTMSQGIAVEAKTAKTLNDTQSAALKKVQEDYTRVIALDEKITGTTQTVGIATEVGTALGVIALACGLVALCANVFFAATAMENIAGLGNGVCAIVKDAANIQSAKALGEMAPLNGDIALQNASSQNASSLTRWASSSLTETTSRLSQVASSVTKDLFIVGDALVAALRSLVAALRSSARA